MNHLDPALLSAHLDGALSGKARDGVERHLVECEDCRIAFAELVAQDRSLKPALRHDPGEAYFETFSARVEDRIRAAGLSGVQSRGEGGRGFDFGRWFSSPRRRAAMGIAAAVIAGAGVVLLTARETPPGLREPELDRRIGQRAGEESSAPSLGVAPAPTPSNRMNELQEKQAPEAKKLADQAIPAAPSPLADAKDERLLGAARPEAPVEVQSQRRDVGAAAPAQEPTRPFARTAPAPPVSDERRRATEAGARDALKSKVGALSKELAARKQEPTTGFAQRPTTPPAPAGASSARTREDQDATADQVVQSQVRIDESAVGGHVRGRVVDLAGRPVVGAQVTFPAQGRSVATDHDGHFTLDVPPGEHTISVMAVGYGTQTQQVLVGPESSDLLVALRPVLVLGDGMAFRQSAPSAPAPLPVTPDARADSLERALAIAEADQGKAAIARAPALYDAAALQWQRALPLAIGTPREAHVRFKLAESRFRAWQVGKTQRRAAIAEETLTAFLVRARMGADRDTAARWLDQIKR